MNREMGNIGDYRPTISAGDIASTHRAPGVLQIHFLEAPYSLGPIAYNVAVFNGLKKTCLCFIKWL